MKQKSLLFIVIIMLSFSFPGFAGWRDWFGDLTGDDSKPTVSSKSTTSSSLDNKTVISGLKQALEKASQYAVNSLGQENGFLNNKDVRIPMPDSLGKVEKTLRKLGASRYADEFVETMNHAAEKAIVEAGPVFIEAIRNMSIEDGMKILKGGDNSATDFFRKTTELSLTTKMLPITKNMTDTVGVTSSYKKMTGKLGFARQYLSEDVVDLDRYITRKSLDGLFLMVAREEKKIRSDPVARTTDLLKTVFGAK